ncbi:uncharacterized protein LOC132612911 [Lycium barbarum]|uniref:uncharacterized protein LOC132612911 n=1 Tax=Lycium barbarum TaxID=112863 RepID=UPI00293EAA88|nr:uncharacterized protein LOC132612911 [Lycium barbarum]
MIYRTEFVPAAPALQGTFQERLEAVITNGKFSVKKIYVALLPQCPRVPWNSITLHPNVHPRHTFIVWLALMRRLATVDRLMKFSIYVHIDPLCVFCGVATETFSHLFFNCAAVRTVWQKVLLWQGFQRTVGAWDTEVQWVASWARKKSGQGASVCCSFAMVVYVIWREMNQMTFQKGHRQSL